MNKKRGRGKQDYLRVIHHLTDSYKEGVRSVELARELGISKASVSEMIRRLRADNLVNAAPYSKIFLTKKGRILAEKLYNKHYIIKQFIKKFLGHTQEKADAEAHNLEHAFSDESIQLLQKLIEGEQYSLQTPGYVG
jgi:Mn-dependent DtxR family transcriptional regulator